MSDLSFYRPRCLDGRQVSTVRRYCLCGAVSARIVGDSVVLAGPGLISSDMTDGDQVCVARPSIAVGT